MISSLDVKGLVHSSVTRDGAKETRRSLLESSVDSDSEEVDNVHKESSSEYDEQRKYPQSSRRDDFVGRLTTTNSLSSQHIDVASHSDEGHDGDRLKTVTSASRSTLIVMVKN